MITSEKELEEYVCEDGMLCDFIKIAFDLESVSVVDNQVHIGTKNILDVMCAGLTKGENPIEKIIIVELKFSAIEPKHISQLARYMSAYAEATNEDEQNIYGVLIGNGVSYDTGCILNGEVLSDRIRIVQAYTTLEYRDCGDIWWNNCTDISGYIDSCIKRAKNEE